MYDEAGGQPQQAGAQQLRRIDLYSSAGALLGTDATLQWDAAGNLTGKSGAGYSQVFAWDADNRLRQSLTQVSTGSSTSTYDERYGYDAQGRRLVRQMLAGGTLYVSQYLYSGEDIVKEYGASWTLPVAAYTHGAGTDEAGRDTFRGALATCLRRETMTFPAIAGLRLPLIQAPMAGVQDHRLAAAVSNAGGLGSLPAAMLGADGLRDQLSALQALTDRPINVNFFCHVPPSPDAVREQRWRSALAPYYAEFGVDPAQVTTGPGRMPFSADMAEVLEAFRPAVVSFHFGLPAADLLARVKAWGACVLASATTVVEARWLEAHGADAIIAQGLEAGGHRGHFLSDDLSEQLGTFALLPQVVRAVSRPVIAAGGIADAQGVAAAMALGASAVQVGTAYLCCPEATTSAVHRAALGSEAARHTALTTVFSGRPARGIVNRAMRELGPLSAEAPAFPLATAAMAPLRARAEAAGSGDFSPLWCGQNAAGCQPVPAAELTRTLSAGFER